MGVERTGEARQPAGARPPQKEPIDIIASQHHDVQMRTTINLADDVYEAARALARDNRQSLGTVISELARRGLRPEPGVKEDGLPVFSVPDGAAVIPVDRAVDLLADEGLD